MKRMLKVVSALSVISMLTTAHAEPPADPARLDEVAERGSHVMPFSLEKTVHVFNKTEHGGLQQVVAKDAVDHEQIGLIRQHLLDISERFKQGDFTKQRRIHGDDMPGLAELAAASSAVRFEYRELPNGAEIEYSTEQPALIDAIHAYFNAQLSDHARHAIGGQAHHDHKMHESHQGHKHHQPMLKPADSKE